jgi:hypothetical protein
MLIDNVIMLNHNFIVNIDHFLIFLIFNLYVFGLNNAVYVSLCTFLNSLILILNIMVMLKNSYAIVLIVAILIELLMLIIIEIFTSLNYLNNLETIINI